MKVIHILSIGLGDWHIPIGKMLKKYAPELDIECWTPTPSLHHQIIEVERDGVLCKAIPYPPVKGARIFSTIRELRRTVKYSSPAIIHTYEPKSNDPLLCPLSIFFKNFPLIVQDLGSGPALRPLNKIVEKIAYRAVGFFLVPTEEKKRYLVNQLRIPSNKILIQRVCADFDLFKPMDKREARRILGLKSDKRYLLHVGRFGRKKGIPIIIKVYKKLKKELGDIELILVGGQPSDSLYDFVKREVPYAFNVLPHEDLPLFYSAADVYVTYGDEFVNLFGGVGVAQMEALACNRPVVSTTFRDIPLRIREQLGKAPTNADDFVQCIIDVLRSMDQYKKCREVAMKYFGPEKIANKTLNVYRELTKRYYSTFT